MALGGVLVAGCGRKLSPTVYPIIMVQGCDSVVVCVCAVSAEQSKVELLEGVV